MGIFDIAIGGVSAMALILGLVEFAKKFGLRGEWCIALSMALGVAFGVAYQVSIVVPATFAEWLGTVSYGLALGLAASGLYDVAQGQGEA